MNVGVALALLALTQLVLAWITDRALAPIDRPLFIGQAERRGSDGLGIKEFFSDPAARKGEQRTSVVLRMAGLGSMARSVATALVLCLVGLIATGVILISVDETPPFEGLRLAGLLVASVSVGAALVQLMVKMVVRSLRLVAPGESRFRRGKRTPIRALGVLRTRLGCADVITRYYTVALMGNVITVLAALNL